MIPDTLGGHPVTAIDNEAFSYCSLITSVVVPDGVLTIGDMAFYECGKLVEIKLPESLTDLGNYVFLTVKTLKA